MGSIETPETGKDTKMGKRFGPVPKQKRGVANGVVGTTQTPAKSKVKVGPGLNPSFGKEMGGKTHGHSAPPRRKHTMGDGSQC